MRAFMRFNMGLLASPSHLQAWVLLLIGVNIVTPFFFLEHLEARAVLAAGALGIVLMTVLTARFGFSRIIGLGHVAWVPLMVFLGSQLPEIPATDAFGVWVRAVIVFDATSLVFDAVDAVRFAVGDRAETVPGLSPAPGE